MVRPAQVDSLRFALGDDCWWPESFVNLSNYRNAPVNASISFSAALAKAHRVLGNYATPGAASYLIYADAQEDLRMDPNGRFGDGLAPEWVFSFYQGSYEARFAVVVRADGTTDGSRAEHGGISLARLGVANESVVDAAALESPELAQLSLEANASALVRYRVVYHLHALDQKTQWVVLFGDACNRGIQRQVFDASSGDRLPSTSESWKPLSFNDALQLLENNPEAPKRENLAEATGHEYPGGLGYGLATHAFPLFPDLQFADGLAPNWWFSYRYPSGRGVSSYLVMGNGLVMRFSPWVDYSGADPYVPPAVHGNVIDSIAALDSLVVEAENWTGSFLTYTLGGSRQGPYWNVAFDLGLEGTPQFLVDAKDGRRL